jgi:Putative peptidoglycan binding domain
VAEIVDPRLRLPDEPMPHQHAGPTPNAYAASETQPLPFVTAQDTHVFPVTDAAPIEPAPVDSQPTATRPAMASPADDEGFGPGGTSRIVRRQRLFIVIASAAAVISIAGLIGSTFVRSPAQLAAEQGPPSPSVLTAPVVREVLTETVIVRGTVVAGSSLMVTPTAAQGASALVVTRVVKAAGTAVDPGDVLIEVSGRPVIALPGSTPAYRDLQPSDTGKDVGELQSALKALGYPDADAHDTFGTGTKDAITKLYQHLGYTIPTTGGPGDTGDQSALKAAAQSVTDARRAVTGDLEAVTQANAALATAKSTKPPNPGSVAAGQNAVGQAKQTLSYARQDLTSAQQAQSHLIATTGVEMPLDEFVFIPSFPAHVAALSGEVGSTVTAPLVTLDTGALVVDCVLQQGEQGLLKAGLSVTLDAEQLNQTAAGRVSNIGPYSAGSQSAAGGNQNGSGKGQAQGAAQPAGYPVVVTPSPDLSAAWLGQDVRVTIKAASTAGPVMVVPVAAVSTDQSGSTSVTILKSGDQRVRVPVTAGLDSNGVVAVTPMTPGAIAAGDLVVIG